MKQCFKCKQPKSLDDFYKHPQTADGRLGKCKECTKKDVKLRALLAFDSRKQYEEDRYQKNGARYKNENYQKDYRNANKLKCRAKSCVNNAKMDGRLIRPEVCTTCGKLEELDAHHWSYKKEYWLDVVWCCRRCHMRIHADTLEEIFDTIYEEVT